MKRFDEDGLELCQAAYAGSQCQGHAGHYGGAEWPHFATMTDGAVTWTDEGGSRTLTDEEIRARHDSINGKCCI